jgi:DNA segregation ATPase FtsK/SpoIIIE-like protein
MHTWRILKFSIIRTAFAFVLSGLALFIVCALFTYNSQDPSWYFISTDVMPVHNLCGQLGSYSAALFLFCFGSAAMFLGPFVFFVAYTLMVSSFVQEWDRVIAGVVGIVSLASLEYIYGVSVLMHGFRPGGALGFMIYNGLAHLFDPSVSAIFLHIVLLACVILVVRLSFVRVVFYCSKYLVFLVDKDRFAKPVFRFVVMTVRWMIHYIKVIACYLRSMFDGSFLEHSNQSIMEFEYDENAYDELRYVLDDPIWAQFDIGAHDKERTDLNLPLDDVIEEDEVFAIKEESATISLHAEVKEQPIKNYELPPLNFFKKDQEDSRGSTQEHEMLAHVLEEKLARFGIAGTVVSIKKGPVITLFEYQPHIDSKISKIMALEDDLALALQAMSIRIIAPIPGTSVVGFEVANKERSTVLLSTILYSKEFASFSGLLPLVVGVDTIGNTVIADLVSMPHILIAGATGSGKSVALNVILISLLYRCKPDELKLILIDPKRLEFAPYADIPHLVFPIVTNPKDAAPVLQWVINTMEERYENMAKLGVRNIIDYNKICHTESERLPFIVVMIDELSDLMMIAGKDIEERIARIAQMARAAGIHLVVATQRPSVDVITGIIKANFPSRISFKVATKIDSRTILDTGGADKLLGKGDMLYLNASSQVSRMHGAYVSDIQIERVASFTRSMQRVQYHEFPHEVSTTSANLLEADQALYRQVIEYIQSIDEVSISLLQRTFRIGYNRSARVIDMLEAEGHILPSQGGKMRKVIRS